MICPKCHQPVQVHQSQPCPLCHFDLEPFGQRVRAIYAISTGFFVSTIAYAAIVWVFEQGGQMRAQPLPPMVPYLLLAAAVLQFGVAVKVGQRLDQTNTMAAVQRLFLIKLALVEAVAVYGVALYLLTGSLHWFVTFLALSWLGFLIAGAQMPHIVERLAELAVGEGEAP